MKLYKLLFAIFFLTTLGLGAQTTVIRSNVIPSGGSLIGGSATPSGSCTNASVYIQTVSPFTIYGCTSANSTPGTWSSPVGSGGAVTSVNGQVGAVTITTLAVPTGTGFVHVTSGTADGTASNIDLSSQVTGNLPAARINSGTGASSTTYLRGDMTWVGLPTATSGTLGVVRPDGTTITISGGVLTAVGGGGGMVYPGAGIPVSTGTAWGSSLTAPTGTLVGTTDTQTLTNKTVNGVTPTTFGFLDATSSIQTQLNGKLATNGSSAALSVATTGAFGVVKPDGTSITISGGIISAVSGGGGTVTTISDLSPLFTVTSRTSTPTFVLTNAAQNSVLAGPATGGAGAPSYQTAPTISAANMTNFPTLNQNTTGSAATLTTIRSIAGNSFNGSANTIFANKFILQGTSDAGMSQAQYLGALSTGIVKNTTTTGVLSIAAGSDIIALLQTLTGCNTTNNVLTPQSGTCVAPSGGSMVYPGAGVAVSTGTAWGTSLTAPAGAIVGTTDTQTLTNKTINVSQLTGTLSAALLPTATTSALGAVKVDGTTIVISSGIISATGGGSGSGITGLTSGFIPLASGPTTLGSNSPLDYNITNAGYVTITKPVIMNDSADPGIYALQPSGVAPTVISGAAGFAIRSTLTSGNLVTFLDAPCSGLWTLANSSGVMASSCTAPPPQIRSYAYLSCFGDSYMNGSFATTADTICSLMAESMPGVYSVNSHNYGIASQTTQTTINTLWPNFAMYPQKPQMVMSISGNNDGDVQGNGANVLKLAQENYMAAIGYTTIPLQATFYASRCSPSGSWSADTTLGATVTPNGVSSTGTPMTTTSSGASETCSIPTSNSTWLMLRFEVATNRGGTFTVNVDGTLRTSPDSGTTTWSSQPPGNVTTGGASVVPSAYVITGLTPGTHSVVITSSNSSQVTFDSVQWLPDDCVTSCGGFQLIGGNSAFTYATDYDTAFASLISTVQGLGLYAWYASQINGTPGVNGTTDIGGASAYCNSTGSSNHPNTQCGYFHMAQTIYNAQVASGKYWSRSPGPSMNLPSGGGGSMTYPSGTGIAVVTSGTSWGTTLTAPTGAIVGTTDTQTLTNKAIDGATATEISYVAGVTSAIQVQLNNKQTSYGSGAANLIVATPNGSSGSPVVRAMVAADLPTITFTGDVSGNQGATVVNKINGVTLSGLATGILKNTNSTGVPSIATYADIVAIFGSGSCSGYLKSDGTCATPTGGGMVYPSGSGIAVVSSGTSWGTTLAAPTGTIVGTTDTQTLTNKTVDGASATEISYVAGVTSAIQSQLNSKQAAYGSGAANLIVATPNGISGVPVVRAMVGADVPAINLATGSNGGVTGTLPTGNGGTGNTALTFPSGTATLPKVVSQGTITLATSAIASGACQTVTAGSVNSVAITGLLTTDEIHWTPNGSLKAVTGYVPGTGGGLSIEAYPTSGNANWDVCNWSASSITPGSVTLNYQVLR